MFAWAREYDNNSSIFRISRLIEECYNEADIDKKTQLLYKINSVLPKLSQENSYVHLFHNTINPAVATSCCYGV